MEFKIIEPEKKLMRFFGGWDFLFILVSFLPLFLLGLYLIFSKTVKNFSSLIGIFALLTSIVMVSGFFFSYSRIKRIGDGDVTSDIRAPILFLLKVYVLTSVVPLLFISIFMLLWIFPILIKEERFNLLYIIILLIGFSFLLSFFTFFSFRKKLFSFFDFLRAESYTNLKIAESQIEFLDLKDVDELYTEFTELYESLFKLDYVSMILRKSHIKTYDLNKDFIMRFLEKMGERNEFNVMLSDEAAKYFKDIRYLYVFKFEIKDGKLFVLVGRKNENFYENEILKIRTLARYFSLNIKRLEYEDERINFFTHSVNIIVSSLEGNIVPRNHLQNVARYSNMISRELNLDDERRKKLYFAALLHDIGFLKIPVELQGLPEKYKLHPILGAEIVSEIELWKDLSEIIKYHHEAFDGSGYPEGIKGDKIPIESRIIAVAESFDALTNEYSYKSIVDKNFALSDIESKAGTRYDPEVVEAFIKCFRKKEE